MVLDYDTVAKDWCKLLDQLPSKYINLIRAELQLSSTSHIIDLGCGSGLLTTELAKISENVTGLDVSKAMIELAIEVNKSANIEWINLPVEEYTFRKNYYDLIIGFESMHHFFTTANLRSWCNALKINGFIALGFSVYSWEKVLSDIVVESFKNAGVFWGDWHYYQCPQFQIINSKDWRSFSKIKHLELTIPYYYNIQSIAELMISIDKAIPLNMHIRRIIFEDICERFEKRIGGMFFDGTRTFHLYYSQKR